FLKAPLRELELTRRVVQKYALACPQVAFRLADGGRPRLALPPGTPLERIGAVFGREAAAEMIAVQWQAMDMRITGFISPPALARSRRDRQYFFVNGRPVRSGLLAVMLERPYAGLLPPGRYPLAVIHIQLDPGFVDVNVHPQKAEVRFSRERSVYGALSQAVSNALSDFPRLALAGEDSVTWPFEGQAGFVPFYNPETPAQLDSLRPLAQIHNSYILAQSDDGVLIIDQHAAHEQILFEQVTAGAAGAEIGPTQLELTAAEAGLLTGHLPLFAGLGFELEPFGERVFLLRRVPAALKPHLSNQVARSTQPGEAILLATLLEELQTCKTNAPEVQRDRLAQKGACVCAVKTGDVLSPKTMQTLLDDLLQLWSPAACPHGRPVFVSLSLAELERRFGRR
ncbi:MAG: hypothetical protein ACE5G8_15525, partial [Anaerolineae bacterium]